jgi:large subunit ribosomal protein L10
MERDAIARKKKEVERLTEKLEKATSFYLVDYTGLDANAMNILRKRFRSANCDYFVIKNSILQRASEKLGFGEVEKALAGPNSISISYEDPIGPARIIYEYYREANLPEVKLCYIEGKWFSAKEARRLADLPSREVLLSQLLNLLMSPMSRFAGIMHNLISGFARVVDGIREKKQKETPAHDEHVASAGKPQEQAEETTVSTQEAAQPGEGTAVNEDSVAETPETKPDERSDKEESGEGKREVDKENNNSGKEISEEE